MAQLKFLKLTGITLELYLPSIGSNILCGENNYLSTVKKIKIGQSAAKRPYRMKVQRLNRELLKSCKKDIKNILYRWIKILKDDIVQPDGNILD